MNFDASSIKSIISRTLQIECFELTLTQNTKVLPASFHGVGSLSLQENGCLILKLYDSTSKSSMRDILTRFADRSHGIVPDSSFYSLSAVDENGNTWTYAKLYIDPGLRLTSHGAIISLKIPFIHSRRSVTHSIDGSCAEIVVIGNFTLPYNQYHKSSEGGSSLSVLQFKIGIVEIKIRQCSGYLSIDLSSPEPNIDGDFITKLAEGLGIAIGREVAPAYYRIGRGGHRDAFVYGGADTKGLAVMRPLVDVFYAKENQLIRFINAYIERRNISHDHLINYWRRLYYVPDMVTDVAALVLTVNIEGLIKNYFSESRAHSAEAIGAITLAKKIIKKTKLPAHPKIRIQCFLGELKQIKPTNILKELVSEGLINLAHVESWRSLRNSLAHADNLKDEPLTFEKFVFDIKNCLDLFYRLIGLAVGFDITQVEDDEQFTSAPLAIGGNS